MYQLPIGISHFRELITYSNARKETYLYVDKTQFIEEIDNDGAKVIIITRPRRFGKTMNLSMLECFYAAEVEGQATKGLFDKFNIFENNECIKRQGTRPVIFLSLKDIKQINFTECLEKLKSVMADTYKKYRTALDSEAIPIEEHKYIDSIIQETGTAVQLELSLKRLIDYLNRAYNKAPILLIDEYDTPIQQSYIYNYYDNLIPFMRNFFGSALKDNQKVYKAVMTGILRVSKESLFSDLNNVKVYSILSEKYAKYFGFTEEEVKRLFSKMNLKGDFNTIKNWFNGYHFGGQTLYNPWSLVSALDEGGLLKSYWINTSGNKLVKDFIVESTPNTKEKLERLISGKSINELVDEHIVFGDLKTNRSAMWSMLLMSGYLKYSEKKVQGRYYSCELSIPNKEVLDYYCSVIKDWMFAERGISWYKTFLEDLTLGRIKEFEEKLQVLIKTIVSHRDVSGKENFFHGIMLGLVAGLQETHHIKSNRESGDGVYDVALIPKRGKQNGIVMEFKATHKENDLEEFAKKALRQILSREYSQEIKEQGVENVISLGIAFSKKKVRVVSSFSDVN